MTKEQYFDTIFGASTHLRCVAHDFAKWPRTGATYRHDLRGYVCDTEDQCESNCGALGITPEQREKFREYAADVVHKAVLDFDETDGAD